MRASAIISAAHQHDEDDDDDSASGTAKTAVSDCYQMHASQIMNVVDTNHSSKAGHSSDG